MTTPTRKPWFGPKRVGWGIRPASWQGWLIVLAFALALIVVGYLITGHF